ncbi:unnamed protein product [Cyprideis torosa]|uniref:Uncharacterized protein n=1 Tax=Cyprideis torosa TaxID=163714 RepID=A0A7R8ZMT0_9CRUS|nr:unnamed protein product [Cyprideis torosa]CAG0896352.1 unnamed protein product [Cyprideis torosa]
MAENIALLELLEEEDGNMDFMNHEDDDDDDLMEDAFPGVLYEFLPTNDVPKIENYVEIVDEYNEKQFRENFRVSRKTYVGRRAV